MTSVADHGVGIVPRRGRMTADERAVAASGLFDAAFYRAEYPELSDGRTDPLKHFCRQGWQEGRNPNPRFDTGWYMQTNPDVVDTGQNPLAHYALAGEREGRRPCAGFDPAWYRWFAQLDSDAPALAHFLAQCRDAAPAFDAAWYLQQYPDVAAAGVDPFAHYVLYGAAEGRAAPSDVTAIAASGLFDASYYLIGSPDVGESGGDPLTHFCVYGWREGRRPNPYFDPLWYRQVCLKDARFPVNPLLHYAREGEAAGLRPCAYFDTAWYRETFGLAAADSPLLHYLRHRRSQRFSPTPHFDHAFYLQTYGHLIGPNRDPFAHFLVHGARKDLNPSPDFDAAGYRAQHMAPAEAGRPIEEANPLVHFLLQQATPPGSNPT